jgi:hypothetical protein
MRNSRNRVLKTNVAGWESTGRYLGATFILQGSNKWLIVWNYPPWSEICIPEKDRRRL